MAVYQELITSVSKCVSSHNYISYHTKLIKRIGTDGICNQIKTKLHTKKIQLVVTNGRFLLFLFPNMFRPNLLCRHLFALFSLSLLRLGLASLISRLCLLNFTFPIYLLYCFLVYLSVSLTLFFSTLPLVSSSSIWFPLSCPSRSYPSLL